MMQTKGERMKQRNKKSLSLSFTLRRKKQNGFFLGKKSVYDTIGKSVLWCVSIIYQGKAQESSRLPGLAERKEECKETEKKLKNEEEGSETRREREREGEREREREREGERERERERGRDAR